jgi:hypothetical protein
MYSRWDIGFNPLTIPNIGSEGVMIDLAVFEMGAVDRM